MPYSICKEINVIHNIKRLKRIIKNDIKFLKSLEKKYDKVLMIDKQIHNTCTDTEKLVHFFLNTPQSPYSLVHPAIARSLEDLAGVSDFFASLEHGCAWSVYLFINNQCKYQKGLVLNTELPLQCGAIRITFEHYVNKTLEDLNKLYEEELNGWKYLETPEPCFRSCAL